ncbi:MAG TPA: ATP-dependent DNA helicase RecG [Candidatus Paceibacterota bacterium]|nr:ATP-dependent DNA helicase RecG [Candidatus Paceibacterota bacterium]
MNLHDKLEAKFRLDEKQKKALKKLGLATVQDLLFYFPSRYSDIREIKNISELVAGETATVYGRVSKLKTKKGFKTKIPMGEAEIEDLSGKIKIIWFNQAYLAKMIHEGENVKLSGHVTEGKYGLYLANPEFEKVAYMPIDSHDTLFKNENGESENRGFSFPVYPETKGITSRWIYHTILKIFKDKTLEDIEDYIPEEILKTYHLPSLKSALIWVHTPKNPKDAESARKRFAFEEVFFIQLERQHDRMEYRKNKSFKISSAKEEVDEFLKRFPFELTASQKKSIDTILADIQKDIPMSRLLEGDVGSGKTAVAAAAAHAIVNQKTSKGLRRGLQVAYMAPTEILAAQHFESFIKNFAHMPINIGLLTGSGCRKFPSKVSAGRGTVGWTDISRTQLLKWVAGGEIPILIGTHALIQKTVKFKNLAFAVIDEQHRFGTAQRRKLVRKDSEGVQVAPHLLSMTATPIPRTLALTIYGDLDLSLLDEMPSGRKPIITEIVTPEKRDATYEKIHRELGEGRQLYVICPRIFEPDPEKEMALLAKSAVAEAKRLKKEVFPDYEIGVLHSKMSKQKKEEVMKDFSDGKIHILCATSVVEVGVNVPNATVIIIEGAERFGLAQLHQLRGRVIRSSDQAYCYVFAEAKSQKTMDRLKALKTAKNGFELAELDLTLRGAGELSGGKQWGVSDLAMEAIKNLKMVEAARTEAVRLISQDPELKKYPNLKARVKEKLKEFHFE